MTHRLISIFSNVSWLTILIFLFASPALLASNKCGENQNCANSAQDEQFDFRGQSTFMKLSPGDTTRIKIVLYSNNEVRIALCNEAVQHGASLKIIRAIREYNRVIERIEKRIEEEPIYKFNRSGQKITVKENGKPKLDAYGEPVYEIESYRKIEQADTIWRTNRNIREETIFDSHKAEEKKFFEDSIDKTMSVIIEIAIPANPKQEGTLAEQCVGVMVGRRFRDSNK